MSTILNPRLEKSRTGVWEIRWTQKGPGRSYSKTLSTRTTDRLAAEKFMTGFLDASARAVATSASPTIEELCTFYSSSLTAAGAGETQHICLSHIVGAFGKTRLCDLTHEKILAYRAARQVKSGTLRRELQTLRAALNHAAKHRKILATDIPFIDLPRPSQSKETYLSDAEEREFYRLALRHTGSSPRMTRLARFVAIALDTAARKEAITGLTWDRVDFSCGMIDFREPGLAIHNKRRAVVPISKRLDPLLRRMRSEKTSEFVLDHPGSIRKQWETWIATTPFAHVTPHDLRRTWATLAAQRGVPIPAIAGVLADDPRTVMIHYAKFIPGDARSAVNARF
ncbi:MAG: tyrosine-type recombinase/integrase [Methylocystis sp.]|nr:tyrosine-type recombinase/integrase [Methylocystis sp.]